MHRLDCAFQLFDVSFHLSELLLILISGIGWPLYCQEPVSLPFFTFDLLIHDPLLQL